MGRKQKIGLSYRDAGVDIDAGNALIERIKPYAKRTARKESLSGIGGFGALFKIPEGYRKPVLVSGTDGVGTKLKFAIQFNQHKQIGQDLVAMCVNDIIVANAEPLFFLDYYATGRLDIGVAESIIESIADGCEISGCTLAGGETAEMPDMYQPGYYDLAGFCVGVAEEDQIIDGHSIDSGHVIIGLPSSGPHSNGYSLIRKVISYSEACPETTKLSSGETLLEAIMKPTRIYVKSVLKVMESGLISGAAHITGGGFQENLQRSFGNHLTACIDLDSWARPEIFRWLNAAGRLGTEEMFRTFNCGIGFVLFCDAKHATKVIADLKRGGESPKIIGRVTDRRTDVVTFNGAFD